jgi:hypothetical protein
VIYHPAGCCAAEAIGWYLLLLAVVTIAAWLLGDDDEA